MKALHPSNLTIQVGVRVNQKDALNVFQLWIFEDGQIFTSPLESTERTPNKPVRDYMQIGIYLDAQATALNPRLQMKTDSTRYAVFEEVPNPVTIKLEIQKPHPTGGSAIYQTTRIFHGSILRMTTAQQKATVKKAWQQLVHPKDEKLIAYHLPVEAWQRVEL